jgi:transcriptional regulator with XRE-family HTH domain
MVSFALYIDCLRVMPFCQLLFFYINNNIKMSLERFVINNIKRIRKEKGFSQEKLAEACDTDTSYIGLMETYKNVPKLSTIERIARALNVDPLEFFKDKNKIPLEQEIKIQDKKKSILLFIEKELDNILHN